MNRLAIIAGAMALVWATTSSADSTAARCDIYPAGEDHAEKMIHCEFSQRQGYITIAREDGVIDGMMALTIPAGASTTIEIGHEVQSAYMAYCDRFATAAVFAVDGAEVEVIAEHRVVRRTPLRR